MVYSALKLLALFFAMKSCFAAKFAIIPMFGRSHFMVLFKLAEELTSRGHEVTIYAGEDSKYAIGKPGVNTFPIPAADRDASDTLVRRMTTKDSGLSFLQTVKALNKLQQQYCNYLLQNKDMVTAISKADMVIGESLYPCGTLVADMLSIPHAVISSGPINTPFNQIYGVSLQPSHIPQTQSGLSANGFTFAEKIKNLAFYFTSIMINEFFRYPTYNELKVKYNIKPNKSIKETLSTFELVLLSSDFALDIAQPLPPNLREVGYFLPAPAKPLPADLEEFMQSSGDDGVILVSFGSMVNKLQDKVVDAMASAFAKFPQKVLWKIKLDSYKGKLSSNIKTVTWLPQNDILGHPKTKLFITHSGINGIAESAYHGVPMVCSPFFGDQMDNSQRMKDHGMAEIMPVRTATSEQLVQVLSKVLNDKSYKQNALHVSRAMKMRRRTPTQEAAELLEYVLSVGSMSHLRPRALDMSFYELYMLDVLGVLGIALVFVLVVLAWMGKVFVRVCLGLSGKTKTE